MFKTLFLSLSLSWFLRYVHCGYEIYGTLQQAHYEYDALSITATCFAGLSLETCGPHPDDDIPNFLPYFEEIVGIWCLQCCSSGFATDEWVFSCPLTPTSAASNNKFGYSFRIARMKTLSDLVILECPLNRSACPFESDRSFDIRTCGSDFSFLSGIILDLEIEEHVFFTTNWIEVKRCDVTVLESSVLPTSITQVINMNHSPTHYSATPYHILYIVACILLAFILAYRLIKRRECISCGLITVFHYNQACLHCLITHTSKPGLPMDSLMKSKEIRVYGIGDDPILRSAKVHPQVQQDVVNLESISERVFMARVNGDEELKKMYDYMKSDPS